MTTHTMLLVDENEQQRHAYGLVLNELFHGTGVVVKPIVPLPQPVDYNVLVAGENVSALILDQKMEDGSVGYTGTQLSTFVRGVVPKLPIFILSNYTEEKELFEAGESDVEYIIDKKHLNDPTSREAQIFKARVLRRLNVFADVLAERAQRYHDLLVRSLTARLSADEEKELGLLDVERAVPQQAAEIVDIKTLDTAIADIRKRLESDGPAKP
ncbi:MAG: hypothetical protein JWM32_910 [Verrucomicrobia bacterium]|nr:hypothetical protein [Verrucomicrobiota bacterium]